MLKRVDLSVDTSERKAVDPNTPITPYPRDPVSPPVNPPLSPSVLPSNGKFVIVSSDTINKQQLDTLQFMGKVVVWEELYSNTPIDKLDFDYLFVKLNKKSENWITDNLPNEKYHLLALCKQSQDWLNDLEFENILRKLPDKIADKEIYNNRLLRCGKLHVPDKSLSGKFKRLLNSCLPLAESAVVAGASQIAKKI